MRAGTHGETRADALLALQDDGIVEATEGDETRAARSSPRGRTRAQPGDARRVARRRRRDRGHRRPPLPPSRPRSPTPSIDNGDLDPVALEATRRSLLSRCADAGTPRRRSTVRRSRRRTGAPRRRRLAAGDRLARRRPRRRPRAAANLGTLRHPMGSGLAPCALDARLGTRGGGPRCCCGRRPGVLVTVAAACAVMTTSLAAVPLFLSSVGTESVALQASERCPRDTGVSLHFAAHRQRRHVAAGGPAHTAQRRPRTDEPVGADRRRLRGGSRSRRRRARRPSSRATVPTITSRSWRPRRARACG